MAPAASDWEKGEQRVSPLELFFDLVFVFGFTQVSVFLSHNATWEGLLRASLILGALWWAWSGYAWLTNMVDPEEGIARLVVLGATGAMLVVALATPGAFGSDGVIFGVGYLIVRLLHMTLLAIASRRARDPALTGATIRTAFPSVIAPILLIVAGFQTGGLQLALWGLALAILYLSPLVGHMRGWRVSPEHFVERYGIIIIIALGESVAAIEIGTAGHALDAGIILGSLLGVTVAACLWWAYFDWVAIVIRARLIEATGPTRAALARDAYNYLHFPMVAGIILFAFGLKATLADVTGPLPTLPAIGLCGGVALYMAAHVLLRLRIRRGFGGGRTVTAAVLLVLIPIATVVPALAALGLVATTCVCLIAYEVIRHRADRARIRHPEIARKDNEET